MWPSGGGPSLTGEVVLGGLSQKLLLEGPAWPVQHWAWCAHGHLELLAGGGPDVPREEKAGSD